MNEKTKIIPAILPRNLEELEEKLNLLKEAYQILDLPADRHGLEDKLMVQIDICNNELFEIFDFSIINKYLNIFDFELDLMGINIAKVVERLNELSRSNFNRIIFHYEDWGEKFSNFKFENFSPKIGLALVPNTSIEKITQYLDKINFVQFMGIDEVGVQGSQFNPQVIEKIKEFRNQNLEVIISVDGGVNLENAQSLINAGVNRLVSGSAIFEENNLTYRQISSAQQIIEKIKEFNELVK